MIKKNKLPNREYGLDDLETFGLKNIQLRKEYFLQKAAKLQQAANGFTDMASNLDKLTTQALKTMTKLAQQGKQRLDGKTATALVSKGIGPDCGIVAADTRLHCTNDVVELKQVYWADNWVVDMVNTMKDIGLTANQRSRFYKTLEDHKGDPEAMQAEAGLIILGDI